MQRWYEHKKVEKVEKEKTLERGSVIRLEESNLSTKYVITAVFKVDGKKWYMAPNDDNPAWPVEEKEIKKYRVAIREVNVEDNETMRLVTVKEYGSIKERKNVRSTYKFVKNISEIKANMFKVNL